MNIKKRYGPVLLLAFLALLVSGTDAFAHPSFADGGRQVGRGFVQIFRATGTAFKESGRAVGRGFKHAGKETGKAFRQMGRDVGHAFSGKN
ncbi:MAG: hypothetical protein FIA94_12955 [Nitrospirae bacterium]|nr:hypothetical protein [Nitrospirota bacterium]